MPTPSALERIRSWLREGQPLTYSDLQKRTHLSERQLGRLIHQLRQEGLPVQEVRQGKHKVFTLPPERQLVAVPDLQFDNAELRALAVAAKASRAILAGTPHAAALRRAFDQLLAHAKPVTYLFDVDEPGQEWFFDDSAADTIALDCFRLLEQAMDERQTVRFDYLTASTGRQWRGRRLDPYAFVKRQRSWQLVGYCHERQRVQHFAMTRVSHVEPCPGQHYEMMPGFDPEQYFRGTLGAFASGDTHELQLLVEPSCALHFRERQYHPTQQIEQERPDGRLLVSYELEGLDEMRSFCQSWGTGITVLEPAELREKLRQEAETIVVRYRETA
jgi:predicted DNA-binding transcriptional regulator YafY